MPEFRIGGGRAAPLGGSEFVVGGPSGSPPPPTGGGTPPEPQDTAGTAAGDELYRRMMPWAVGDADRGYPMRALCRAAAAGFERMYALAAVDGDEPPLTRLFDVDRADQYQLPWLGQLVGVRSREPSEALRSVIRERPPWKRGTLGAMRAAVFATLTVPDGVTPEEAVRVVERASGPYAITVITRVAHTPDPDASRAAAMTQKPAGLVLSFEVSDAPLIDEGTRTIDAATGMINSATLADIT